MKSSDPRFSSAKLLVIHADDFGMTASINDATIAALEKEVVSSASVMVPCPCFAEAAQYGREHPEKDIGIHITLISEWRNFRWGPSAPRDQVPSLLAPDGYFWPSVQLFAEHAKLEEVATEIESQIESALRTGLQPTHIDCHMFALFFDPAFYSVYTVLARRSGIPFIALSEVSHGPVSDQEIFVNSLYIADPKTTPEDWATAYLETLGSLESGVSQIIVHLGIDEPEFRQIAGCDVSWGSKWRQRDLKVVSSSEFKAALASNNLEVVDWKKLSRITEAV